MSEVRCLLPLPRRHHRELKRNLCNGKPYYRVVFKNEKGFAIGFNWVLVPASVSTLGKNGPEGLDYCITRDSDYELFTRGIVNNAAYEYFNRCDKSDLDIALRPSNLRFWMFKHLNVSSAVMLQQGAFYYSTLIGKTLGEYTKLLELFSPDITIGTKEENDALLEALRKIEVE